MPQKIEVTLVRELEIAYSSSSAPSPVAHASPYQWANACHELLQSGRIDVLEHAVRYLHGVYPELNYLKTVVGWLDRIPSHLPGLLAFSDDPAAEIQVIKRNGCEAVLLCFCASQGTLGLPLNLIHQWLGRLPVSLVYIKDFRDLFGAGGYPSLGPDRSSSLAELRRIVSDLQGKQIYTLGVSYGGFAALHYGLELAAVGALTLGGDTDLTPEFIARVGGTPAHFDLLRRAPDYARNLREIYASAARYPRVILAFGSEFARDRRQAERMSELPNVQLLPVPHSHHNVVDPLIRCGQFLDLLYSLLGRADGLPAQERSDHGGATDIPVAS